jgi:NADPH2:quinone reductase
MRAAWYDRQGEPAEVLQLGAVDRPVAGPGEVRVRIEASGVNPSDTYGRRGSQAPMAFARIIPHQDGAGTIDAVGDGVPAARVGERVWIYEATWNRPGGTAAEWCVVPAARAVPLPAAIDFDAAACLGIPALTAHRALFADGPIRGQTVLVTGGAGAVGSTAIQLAKWGGAARVLATVSSDQKAQAARAAGADETINYRVDDVPAVIAQLTGGRGVERIVEVDFGGNLPVSLQSIAPHGTIAGYATRGDMEPGVPFRQLMVKNVRVLGVLVYTMPEQAKVDGAADITRALASGALRPVVGARLPLARIAEAHTAVERGTIIGNVVLRDHEGVQ